MLLLGNLYYCKKFIENAAYDGKMICSLEVSRVGKFKLQNEICKNIVKGFVVTLFE